MGITNIFINENGAANSADDSTMKKHLPSNDRQQEWKTAGPQTHLSDNTCLSTQQTHAHGERVCEIADDNPTATAPKHSRNFVLWNHMHSGPWGVTK